jgi:tRNA(Ile)-lysidine synthetase-like protein
MMQLSHASTLNDLRKKRVKDPEAVPVTMATTPQIRMTRRIVGEYTLHDTEVHQYFEDSIGMVSDWRKRGPVYEVPYRTLYSAEVKNLICAGRCTSVTDSMWDIMRVIPCCAVTGQAAGTAAALSTDFSRVDVAELQKILEQNGVVEPESEHIQLAEKLVFSPKPSAKAEFPGGVTIARNYGVLTAVKAAPVLEPVLLQCPGEAELPAAGLRVSCTPTTQIINTPDCFTAQIRGNITLRPRLPGDEIRLHGGTKSLKKLYIDRKIPALQRALIPVVTDEKGVVGVYGIGADLDRLDSGVMIRFTKI